MGSAPTGGGNTRSYQNQPSAQRIDDDRHEDDHQPVYDPNIDDLTREQRRAEREAAAKARMEKNKISSPKKTKRSSSPLKGPNSRNTMTWTL